MTLSGYRINAAVTGSGSVGAASTVTTYTCTANGFAIVNFTITCAGQVAIVVDNRNFYVDTPTANGRNFTIYVGPSQAVQVIGVGTASTYAITGVEFKNP